MPKNKDFSSHAYSIVGYSIPKYHEGQKSFVDFMCFDPASGKMRRKKYHLDRYERVAERRAYAAELIANLTIRLRQGWNVWAEKSTNTRNYSQYEDVIQNYQKNVLKLSASGSIKKSTKDNYLSYLRHFTDWLSQTYYRPVTRIYQLTTEVFSDFLDYLFLDCEISARTRNNYLIWAGAFCSWMISKGYMNENPCAPIKKLKEAQKFREQLSAEQLQQLRRYLNGWNRHYLLACQMEYYTFIRPEELTHVRIGDISIKEQKIVVSGEFTKNRKDGAVALNDTIIKLMIDLGIFSHASGEYLFGGRDFLPSANKLDSRAFRETFQKVRKKLGWPPQYQFYSLKDTGIRDLANAEGIVVARDQARHADVSTTNRYLKADSLTVHNETKHFEGGL